MNLSDYRKQADLTQEQLAEKIGVSVTAVSNWETGVNAPKTENLKMLSEVYGVPSNELFKVATGQKQNDIVPDNTDFPKCLFQYDDDKYIPQLVFTERETEMIRLLAVCSGEYGTLDIGRIKNYNPQILSKLPDWYYNRPGMDIITANEDLLSIWSKFFWYEHSSENQMYLYDASQKFIIKYLFEDSNGKTVKSFNIFNFDKVMWVKFADFILETEQQYEKQYYIPCLYDIYNVCYHIKTGTFSIEEFVKNGRGQKYTHTRSPGRTLFDSEIQNWVDIFMKENIPKRFNYDPGWKDSDWELNLMNKGKELLQYLDSWRRFYKDEEIIQKKEKNYD